HLRRCRYANSSAYLVNRPIFPTRRSSDLLDEVRARDREERHLGLASNGAREQRLAGAGIADHQHTARDAPAELLELGRVAQEIEDRKSTRLNSSHVKISYAVFCLKKQIIN